MKQFRRAGALLLCAAFLLILFVSASYLVREAGHHCSDDDCPVCRTLAATAEMLRSFGSIILVSAVLYVAAAGWYSRQRRAGTAVFACGTLVSWKIRLND